MARIDFLITNPGHHPAMFMPVMRLMAARGHQCRVLSLCELRGFRSPSRKIQEEGYEIERILPFDWRSSPSVGQSTGTSRGSVLRKVARRLAWRLVLHPGLARAAKERPALVVLPNDGAFPFDRACAFFRAADVPFVVVQEGIRFRRPAGTLDGQAGADAYAVWGPSSRQYYLDQGAPSDHVVVTGCPRFDIIGTTDWTRDTHRIRERHGLSSKTVLFLSNPIDDLGFTSAAGKLDLFRRFIEGLGPLFADPDFKIAVKLHGRESVSAFEDCVSAFPHSRSIVIIQDTELYPLIAASQAAVMFGSTAGLEVLLFGKPLAVLEIPGFGFIHDFVDSEAARGLTWSSPMSNQVNDWLETATENDVATQRYLDTTVANRCESSESVATLLDQVLRG